MADKFQVDNKRTVKATVTDDRDEVWTESNYSAPGLCFADKDSKFKDSLLFACPGCGKFGSIRCTNPKEKGSWLIANGSLSDPISLSLTPSIHCVGCCGWHGWLTGGEFTIKSPGT